MPQNIKGKVGKEKYLLLLRQYQEEMLEAYLTESEDFKDLLHYCNILYNFLPMLLRSTYDFHIHLDARKLAAITIVGKQSLRAVLRTLIKMYTFAPNFKFGTK